MRVEISYAEAQMACIGSVMVTTKPRLFLLFASIEPPSATMARRAIAIARALLTRLLR